MFAVFNIGLLYSVKYHLSVLLTFHYTCNMSDVVMAPDILDVVTT